MTPRIPSKLLLLALSFGVQLGLLGQDQPVFERQLGRLEFSSLSRATYALPISGVSNGPITATIAGQALGVVATVPTGNRFARLYFSEGDGTPIGSILVELFESRGGLAAERFINLATHGYIGTTVDPAADPFYTDVAVHRIANLPGFIIQTGDAVNGDGTGGSSLGTFPDEFELQGALSFDTPGALAMANSILPDSNNSQFFITAGPTPHLNGEHMIFGWVLEGQDVIDFLIALPRDQDNRPEGPPLLTHVDILDDAVGATVTFGLDSGFTGVADFTITAEAGNGAEVAQTVTVSRQLPQIGAAPASAFASTIDGDRLYLAAGNNGFSIYSLADPAAPAPLASVDTPGEVRQIRVVAYQEPTRTVAFLAALTRRDAAGNVTEPGGLFAYDVTTAETPVLLDELRTTQVTLTDLRDDFYALDIAGNYLAYVARNELGMSVIDVSDPTAMAVVGAPTTLTAGGTRLVFWNAVIQESEQICYCAVRNYGIIAIDVSIPGRFTTQQIVFSEVRAGTWGLDLVGDWLYMTELGDSQSPPALTVYDVSAPHQATSAPRVASIALANQPWQVVADEAYAFVAQIGGNFSVVDVRDPGNPTLAYTQPTSGTAAGPALSGDLVAFPVLGIEVRIASSKALRRGNLLLANAGGTLLGSNPEAIEFGVLDQGVPAAAVSFSVYNSGHDTLVLGALTVPAGFEVVDGLVAALDAGEGDTFSVRPLTANPGILDGSITFTTDDTDAANVTIPLHATVANTAAINGELWLDLNANGVRDPDDQPLGGIVVYNDANNNSQLDASERRTTAIGNGSYALTELISGTYRLRLQIPAAYYYTTPQNGVQSITVGGGVVRNNVDFGVADLPVVSIASSSSIVIEGSTGRTITVSRIGPTTNALTVDLTFSGASSGTDFQLPDQIVIPAGQTSASATLTALTDSRAEGDEALVMTVADGFGYRPGAVPAVTVTIFDIDHANLRIKQVVTSSSVTAGMLLTPQINVENTSSKVAGPEAGFDLELRLSADMTWGNGDDVVVAATHYDELAANTVVLFAPTFVLAANMVPGTYFIGARVDTSNTVPETSESDNTLWSMPFEVTADAAGWEVTFGVGDETVAIGMFSAASDGLDSSFDLAAAAEQLRLTGPLLRDIRAVADNAAWQLAVTTTAASRLRWQPSSRPAGRQLMVRNLASDEQTAFSHADGLALPANTVSTFELSVLPTTAAQVAVTAGWQLRSLTVQPVADTRGLLGAGAAAWRWDAIARRFVQALALQAYVGYWLYAPAAGPIDFEAAVVGAPLPTAPGWNLTPVAVGGLPATAIGQAWEWTGSRLRGTEDLQAGITYWLYLDSTQEAR